MKKIFSLLIVLTVITGSVFADFSWSGDAELSWSPIGGNADEDLVTAWGLDNSRVGLTAKAQNEDATFGAQTRINANKGGIAGEVTWGWWQPIKQVRITIGQIDHREGGVMGSLDAQDKLGGAEYGGGGGDIFTGFGRTGGLIELFPIDNLAIGVNIGTSVGDNWSTGVLAPVGVAATYTFPDLFDIRLGFFGNKNEFSATGTVSDLNGQAGAHLDVATRVIAVQNVDIQLGAKIPLGKIDINATLDDNAISDNVEIALGAQYTADALNILAHARIFVGAKIESGPVKVEPGARIGFDVDIDYNLGAFKAGLLFGIQSTGETKVAGGTLGSFAASKSVFLYEAVPYIAKSFAGGNAYCGFKFGNDKDGKFIWSVPVGFGYGF